MSLWSDIDTLILPARFKLSIGYTIRVIGIECYAFLLAVRLVVEKDAAACDAVVRPVVDGAFVVCTGSDDVGAVGIVVEGVCWYPGEMSESVPLGSTLGVQFVGVVVGDVFG